MKGKPAHRGEGVPSFCWVTLLLFVCLRLFGFRSLTRNGAKILCLRTHLVRHKKGRCVAYSFGSAPFRRRGTAAAPAASGKIPSSSQKRKNSAKMSPTSSPSCRSSSSSARPD
ncbi:hypothetical protein DFJ73DRAFT_592858 [Zopfochytrium polystomum]|nr:hypothetical protein DFJ73DRAFT_592858 [Zopfochytrium polystomum]